MLPDIARDQNSEATKSFSKQELYKYLVENGKHNKRQTEKIRDEIQELMNTIEKAPNSKITKESES